RAGRCAAGAAPGPPPRLVEPRAPARGGRLATRGRGGVQRGHTSADHRPRARRALPPLQGLARRTSRMTKQDLFLEEARLGPRNPVLVEYDEAPKLGYLRRRFREYALVDLAHAVMLTETGIVGGDRGPRLLRGLLEVFDLGPEHFPWDPRSGSYLVQVEHFLGRRLGEDVAGRLQTGRSRNDQDAAADRLYLRDLVLRVAAALPPLPPPLPPLALTPPPSR